MATHWQRRDVSVVIPRALARAIVERAHQWREDAGGRFDAREASILIRSRPSDDRARDVPSDEVALIFLSWRMPTDDQVTIYSIAWYPEHGGTEADVWRALELLAGRPLVPGT